MASSSSAQHGRGTVPEITEKDFESLAIFFHAVHDFISTVSQVWPECDATKRYIMTLDALEGNKVLISKLVKKWHEEMSKKCWTDAKKIERSLYDAIDKDNIAPIEQAPLKILEKIAFREKLASIRANPDEDEVEEDLYNMLKHMKKINSLARMIMSIDEDVRKVIQQHSAEMLRKAQRGEEIDMRPLKIGEAIMRKFSSDPREQERVLSRVVKNVDSLAPAIDNMYADMPAEHRRGKKAPKLSEVVENYRQGGEGGSGGKNKK